MAELRSCAATRWDWDKALRTAGYHNPFPRGITHADVDCEIEINGHWLVVEGKRTGECLTGGQLYTMNARIRDARTCLITFGDPDRLTLTHIQHWPSDPVRANWEDYWTACSEWAKWAEAQPRPHLRHSTFRLPLEVAA